VPDDVAQPAKVFSVIGSEANPALSGPQSSSADAATGIAVASALQTPSVSPLQAGVGAGLGAAIVGALADAENGRLSFVRNQQLGPELRQALRMLSSQ
jgi:hypothetical protein